MHQQKSRRIVFILFLLILFLILGIGGLVAFVTAIYKDTYVVKGDTTMSNAKGEIVLTGVATHDLPLFVAPVLPLKELFSVDTIHVTLPGSTAGPTEVGSSDEANNEVGSGEAISEVVPSEINSFRISRVQKINSTAVVFHALGGEQIRVWNGVTTVRLSATGPEIPVCSANVTCAAFQVEGAELAEKYLAEAEALLLPFEEGRRRLDEQCRDPLWHYAWGNGPISGNGRDAAQSEAFKICQEVRLRGYALGNAATRHIPDYFDPTNCLVLSNQAKLEANLNRIGSKVSWIQNRVQHVYELQVAHQG